MTQDCSFPNKKKLGKNIVFEWLGLDHEPILLHALMAGPNLLPAPSTGQWGPQKEILLINELPRKKLVFGHTIFVFVVVYFTIFFFSAISKQGSFPFSLSSLSFTKYISSNIKKL